MADGVWGVSQLGSSWLLVQRAGLGVWDGLVAAKRNLRTEEHKMLGSSPQNGALQSFCPEETALGLDTCEGEVGSKLLSSWCVMCVYACVFVCMCVCVLCVCAFLSSCGWVSGVHFSKYPMQPLNPETEKRHCGSGERWGSHSPAQPTDMLSGSASRSFLGFSCVSQWNLGLARNLSANSEIDSGPPGWLSFWAEGAKFSGRWSVLGCAWERCGEPRKLLRAPEGHFREEAKGFWFLGALDWPCIWGSFLVQV